MSDQNLPCVDCGSDFVYTENDQAFFERNGWQPPKRCRDCRRKKKEKFGDR